MFTRKQHALGPTGRTPTMLKEHLIDENDVELAPKTAPTSAEDIGAELDAKMKECSIEMYDETDEERKERLTIQEKWDNRVMVAYTCIVAIAGEYGACSSVGIRLQKCFYTYLTQITTVLCNVFAMIAYQMGIVEIAFILPLVTGPVVSVVIIRCSVSLLRSLLYV